MSNNLRNTTNKQMKENPYLAEMVFRVVWKQYVKEDVLSRIEDVFDDFISNDKRDDIADEAAEQYVFDGRYDSNLDYWSNLDNLIDTLIV